MEERRSEGLTKVELCALFERLFPHGLAGADVVAEVAPDGWERSPLLACFHPSVDRVFEEQLRFHRNIESLFGARRPRDGDQQVEQSRRPEPTLEDVRREHQPKSVKPDEELAELVGQCLWDVFSDNHDVIAADGRVADIGSFRGASAFLDEYAGGIRDTWRKGDYLRFYMGTLFISERADVTPVYTMIFSRLKAQRADWEYSFPDLHLVDLGSLRSEQEQVTRCSASEAAKAELEEHQRQTALERTRHELAEITARAREDALDRPPPATVCAYRLVYGRDPRGWPPA